MTETTAAPTPTVSPAAMRVQIAHDVIDQLNAKKIRARHGMYIGLYHNDYRHTNPPQEPKAFEEFARNVFYGDKIWVTDAHGEEDAECHVCALGATLLCAVARYDRFEQHGYDRRQILRHLKGVFTERTLHEMEIVFEGWGPYQLETDTLAMIGGRERAEVLQRWFGEGSIRPATRMAAIMDNIIRNGGRFRPEHNKPRLRVLHDDIKRYWVETLRSDEYVQGEQRLRTKDDKYCCLGVLCDLYKKETGNGEWRKDDYGDWVFVDEKGAASITTPAYQIFRWAGLPDSNPNVRVKPADGRARGGQWDTLASANDAGATFAEIAATIEEKMINA